QGTWKQGGTSYGFSGAISRFTSVASRLGSNADGTGIFHLQPGVDLVNPSSNINGGNITVANSWNLAAGTAGNLQRGAFDFSKSYVSFDYRLASTFGIDPGVLTLRAFNGINVNASISDGFFGFRDYLNSSYLTAVRTYLANTTQVIDQPAAGSA